MEHISAPWTTVAGMQLTHNSDSKLQLEHVQLQYRTPSHIATSATAGAFNAHTTDSSGLLLVSSDAARSRRTAELQVAMDLNALHYLHGSNTHLLHFACCTCICTQSNQTPPHKIICTGSESLCSAKHTSYPCCTTDIGCAAATPPAALVPVPTPPPAATLLPAPAATLLPPLLPPHPTPPVPAILSAAQ
jgi:hypothetical protein